MLTEDRIALRNPNPGKTAATAREVRPGAGRVLAVLGREGQLTSTQLAEAVEWELGDGFPGFVRWYVTAVELDLEARGDLRRTASRGRDYVAVVSLDAEPGAP